MKSKNIDGNFIRTVNASLGQYSRTEVHYNIPFNCHTNRHIEFAVRKQANRSAEGLWTAEYSTFARIGQFGCWYSSYPVSSLNVPDWMLISLDGEWGRVLSQSNSLMSI